MDDGRRYRDGAGTRTSEVMRAIKAKIAARALAAGDRLPSIRAFAKTMGVSPSTVVDAYDRLVVEGLIHARRGSGFHVAATAAAPLVLAPEAPPRDRDVDPFWVSRQSLDAAPAVLKPGCGWLPDDWMPEEALRRAIRALARTDGGVLMNYGGSRGSPPLRRHLLGRLAEEGIEAELDQVLLTGSATQSIDLVCRYLLRPNDTVLVDDPCYFNFRALLRAHRVRVVGVPMTPFGPDADRFAAVVEAERPRLYITNVSPQNPTGATLTARTAHQILSIAASASMTIVEDSVFADFAPEPPTTLAALDGLNGVIRIGGFSKSISASVRCGHIVARREWIEDLVDLQVATHFGAASPMAAELIAHVLADGAYRKHLEALRRRLARARQDTADGLRALGVEPWLMPRGGFHLWCRLPGDRPATTVARAALAADVVLAPGDVFSVSGTAAAWMRFNVAQFGDPRVMAVLARALQM